MVQSILTYLQNSFGDMHFENETAAPAKPALSPDNDKNHIFYALLAYNLERNDNKLRFTYVYSLHQKLLRASLLKEWNLAEHFQQKIALEEHFAGESQLSETSMRSIRDPAIAFYHYHLRRDYDAALRYMNSSLASIDTLIDDGFADGMFMKIEQLLNTFRVLYAAGHYEEAAGYAKRVLSYVSGNDIEGFQFPLQAVLRSNQQWHEILHLYLNSILSKAIKAADQQTNDDFLLVTICAVEIPENQGLDAVFTASYDVLKQFLLAETDSAYQKLLNIQVFQTSVPVYMQHFFILRLLSYPGVTEAVPVELLSKILKYQKAILKLGNLTKKIVINQESLAA